MWHEPEYLSIQADILSEGADENSTKFKVKKKRKGNKKGGTLSFCAFVAFTVVSVLLGIHIGRTIKYEVNILLNAHNYITCYALLSILSFVHQ